MSITHNDLSAYIIKARKASGLSQRALADKVGMSRGYLCDIEKGRVSRPSHDIILRIATEAGCDAKELALIAIGFSADKPGECTHEHISWANARTHDRIACKVCGIHIANANPPEKMNSYQAYRQARGIFAGYGSRRNARRATA
jgi:transcriptional regulator with XRE-family HTH domain